MKQLLVVMLVLGLGVNAYALLDDNSEHSLDQDQRAQIEEGNVYVMQAPPLNAEKGQSNLNAYSILGGIGISQTEGYQKCIEKLTIISQMQKAGYFSKEEAEFEAREAFQQLKNLTKEERWLGLFWRTGGGRNVVNGLGLLDW